MKIGVPRKKETNEASNMQSDPFSSVAKKSKTKNLILILTIIFIAFTLSVTLISVIIFMNNDESVQNNQVCSDTLLERAKPAINPTKVDKTTIFPIVKEIENLPNYRADVNCMYILVTYYSTSGFAEISKQLLDELKNIYDVNAGYSPIISEVAWTPDKFDNLVESLSKRNNQYTPDVGSGRGWAVE
jgi:hypothetical protein